MSQDFNGRRFGAQAGAGGSDFDWLAHIERGRSLREALRRQALAAVGPLGHRPPDAAAPDMGAGSRRPSVLELEAPVGGAGAPLTTPGLPRGSTLAREPTFPPSQFALSPGLSRDPHGVADRGPFRLGGGGTPPPGRVFPSAPLGTSVDAAAPASSGGSSPATSAFGAWALAMLGSGGDPRRTGPRAHGYLLGGGPNQQPVFAPPPAAPSRAPRVPAFGFGAVPPGPLQRRVAGGPMGFASNALTPALRPQTGDRARHHPEGSGPRFGNQPGPELMRMAAWQDPSYGPREPGEMGARGGFATAAAMAAGDRAREAAQADRARQHDRAAISPKQQDTAPRGSDTVQQLPPTPEARAALVHRRLKAKHGFSDEQSAAVLGTFHQEARGLDPRSIGGWQNRARGLAQWLDTPGSPRRSRFEKWARDNKRDPDDLYTQVDYFVHELRTDPYESRVANSRLEKATTVENAMTAMNYYERWGGYQKGRTGAQAGERYNYADVHYRNIKSGKYR